MDKHSPGPWRWQEHPDRLLDATGEEVAGVDVWADPPNVDVGDTDARLIAAAPELLACLLKLRSQVHDDCLRDGEEVAVAETDALLGRLVALAAPRRP